MFREDTIPRSQRRGLLALVLLLIGLLGAALWTGGRQRRQQDEPVVSSVQYDSLLLSVDSLRQAQRDSLYRSRYPGRHASGRQDFNPQLFPFDPNTADSAALVSLGFKPWQAGNLLKYRRHGGRFRSADDLARLYGMNPDLLESLRPYVIISEAPDSLRRADTIRWAAHAETPLRHAKRDTVIELNTADTALLQLVCGLGPVRSAAIVSYRHRLGGYHHPEQLLEVYGIDRQTFDQISPHLSIDTTLISPIHINRASIATLRRHPYLNYEQARALYQLRRDRFTLTTLRQVEQARIIDPATLRLIAPYLAFD